MDLIGHEITKKQLDVATFAAAKMNTALPHMLFSGAPGCGKTSMARYLASLNNLPFLSIIPNDLTDYRSVLKTLGQLNTDNYDDMGNRIGIVKPTILFLDEVHNLPLKGQELLGLAMERFVIESGKPNKYIWTPMFTVVGATTMAGKLSKPFRDRFKLNFSFQPYSNEEMERIIRLHARRYKIALLPSAIKAIAKRSRGTPRIAVGFVERARDQMTAIESVIGTKDLIEEMFKDIGIDDEGLTETELKVLRCLFNADGPVGIDNLSIITNEDKKTIQESVEPFLIRKGLILVGSKGRTITPEGVAYIENTGKVEKLTKKVIDFDYERT